MRKLITRRTWERTVQLIQGSSDIWVVTHISPDGDALGSLLGLALALEAKGHRVARLCADPVPVNYQFLPGADLIAQSAPDTPARLGIVVDCDGLARIGKLQPPFLSLPHLIDIDHHATDQAFGKVHMIFSDAGATGEIVQALIRHLGVPLDDNMATCLYTAILTDTGRFCYGNTTAASLRNAAKLVAAGADPHFISRKVYEERSIAATHLLGIALSRLSPALGYDLVSSTLTLQDFNATGASHADTEGIIDHLRAIGGLRVALLMVETDDNKVRVSLRSDGSVDVSKIALSFDGGGHAMAAGCTLYGSVDETREKVIAAVEVALAGVKI